MTEPKYDSQKADDSVNLPMFSVLLCTYGGDDADKLDAAIKSIFEQTVEPSEVVIVEDTTLTEPLENVVQKWKQGRPETIKILSLTKPSGFGEALKQGVLECSNDLIARMDSDDLAVTDRFERQLEVFVESADIDCVGGYVREFIETPGNKGNLRRVPTDPDELRKSAKYRCPMNHPTVMYRKQAVLAAGNYRDIAPLEDYDLWVRMLLNGARIINIPEVLVNMRAGGEMYARRGGLEYFRAEISLFNDFRQRGFLDPVTVLLNIIIRLPVRIAPNIIRRWVYNKQLRY